MKRLVLFAMALAVVCIMPSCGKDPIENPETPEPTAEMIVFGNYTGMDVVTYAHVDWDFNENYGTYSKDFDVDGDGEYDFGLCSRITINPFHESEILYDITLPAKMELQTRHAIVDVYSHLDSTIIQTDSVPVIYIDDIHTCTKLDETDIKVGVYSRYVVQNHSKNDLLNINDTIFRPTIGGGSIYSSNFHSPYGIETDETGTTVYKSDIDAREECFNFPLEEEVYVGFKYVNENGTRLGWIKLIIEHDANGDLIARPLETAIQKEYLE